MKVIFKILLILIWTALSSAGEVSSAAAGSFEWGAGFAAFRANHYRGSDQYMDHVWPLPNFRYSGDVIEAEQSFLRGLFYHNDYISLKLSLSLGLGVESRNDIARKDMPDLDSSFEAGPMIIIKITEREKSAA